MPIGNQKQIDAMKNGIETLYQRMRAVQPHLTITHDDVLRTFVLPEHREVLKSAADIAYMSRNDRWMDLQHSATLDGCVRPEFALLMMSEYGGPSAPLTPRYVALQEDAPPHVVAEITSWVTERLEIQRRFGVVEYVFNTLKNKLETAKQLRYVWPSALILAQSAQAEHAEHGAAWAMKYATFSMQCHPALDIELRNAIRDASVTITTASLLPSLESIPDAAAPKVKIKLRGYTTFEAYGDTITRYGFNTEA